MPGTVTSAPGAKVIVDGVEVPVGTTRELFFSASGLHEVTVTAALHTKWTRSAIPDHEHVVVELGPAPTSGAAGPTDGKEPSQGWSTWRYVAVGSAGVGVATLAASGVFFLTSSSHFDDLKKQRDVACASSDAAACSAATAHTRQFRSDVATPATVLDIVGAVLVAGGATLWFVAPQHAERSATLAPWMTRDAAGVALSGAFR